MFKKSRIKIVAAIMSVLVLLWISTLGLIYISSYLEMAEQNKQMLMAHAEMYTLTQDENTPPPRKPMPNEETDRYEEMPRFQLSTFYTAAISYDRQVLEIQNEQKTLHSDEELEALAYDIICGDKTWGTKNGLAFYQTDKGGYLLVVFMDNTIMEESVSTLFRYTLIFGGIAMVLFLFLSIFLAKKIVTPLEESYKKQKQFISDAGHELKTPVSVVSVNAELLSREIGDNQWLSNIQYENQRMGLLVSQLLQLARTENVLPQMERIDFSHLVIGESLPFESVAFEQGLVLKCEIEPGITLEGCGPQLKQLVSILLDNAISHSKGNGQIHLRLNGEHGCAKLSVINDGDEIPPEQLSQIFERFYRIDAARNGGDKHYGLGLSIAKAIVTAHKGRIQVFCRHGQVEFNVELPLLKK